MDIEKMKKNIKVPEGKFLKVEKDPKGNVTMKNIDVTDETRAAYIKSLAEKKAIKEASRKRSKEQWKKKKNAKKRSR